MSKHIVTLDAPYHPGSGSVKVVAEEVVAVQRGNNGGAVLWLRSGGIVHVIDNRAVDDIERWMLP